MISNGVSYAFVQIWRYSKRAGTIVVKIKISLQFTSAPLLFQTLTVRFCCVCNSVKRNNLLYEDFIKALVLEYLKTVKVVQRIDEEIEFLNSSKRGEKEEEHGLACNSLC